MVTHTFDIRIAVRKHVLVDIRGFEVQPRRITFLFGESGIGKSLIARAIYGLLDPEEYDITINGERYERYLQRPETQEIRKNSFFVFQEPSSHLNPLVRLGEQLREGNLAEAPGEQELLSELWDGETEKEIEHLLEVYPKPYRPSGGEKQRMFLVMALKKINIALEAGGSSGVFVFDEPTGSLDNRLRDIFLSLLFSRFRQQPFTVLLITHDYSMISEVTTSHASLSANVMFKELRRQNEAVELRDFQAATYTGWLKNQEKRTTQGGRTEVPLLAVESEIGVFGRKLVVSRSANGLQPTALELFPGEIVYLKAPSGEGKTTVMKMIMGLIRGELFRMTLGGSTVTEQTPTRYWREHLWGRRLTMVFQHADEALNPRSKVREIFEGLPLPERMTRSEIKRRLGELFEGEITDGFLDKQVSLLSGGQKQRLNLVRGLALDTEILLLDEPLNGLDFDSTTRVIALLEEKQRAGKGILLVSHNEEIVETMVEAGNVLYLAGGVGEMKS